MSGSFRKPYTLSNRSTLSGSSQKKFKKLLLKQFSNLTEADVESLIPKKTVLNVDKLSTKRWVYWADSEEPLFFDNSNGKDDLFPTVYCLWKCPHILPPVIVNHQVSKFIISGADVMLPGVIGGLDGNIRVGERRAVICIGNDHPVCVGQLAVSEAQVASGTRKGKALTVLHHYGDQLWASGHKKPPNEGFQGNIVRPTQTVDQIPAHIRELVGLEIVDDEGDEEKSAVVEEESEEEEEATDSGQVSGDLVVDDANGASGPDDAEATDVSPEEMSQALEEAFLFALKTRIDDDSLPLDASALISNHLAACNLSGFKLDVKKSTYKKLSKFLKEMNKIGLCKEKTIRGLVTIASVDREHYKYTDFGITKAMKTTAKKNVKRLAAEAQKIAATANNHQACDKPKATSSSDKIQVMVKYKPNHRLRKHLFDGVDQSELFSMAEASQVLWNHCEKEDLDQGQGRVCVDPIISHSLFSNINKAQAVPDSITKQVLSKKFAAQLEPYYSLVFPGQEPAKYKSVLPKVTLSQQKRQGNKVVSCVLGLEGYMIEPSKFAKEAKKKFACSVTTEKVEGKKNVGKQLVVIQGAQVIRSLPQYLQSSYGLPAASIKLEGKKKK